MRGTTLLEILLALAIAGAVGAGIVAVWSVSLSVSERTDAETALRSDMAAALERMAADLRCCSRLVEASADAITVTRREGVVIGTEDGVHLLSDGASSWRRINGTPPNDIPAGAAIPALLSEDEGSIFAGGADGNVYLSTDLGNTWRATAVAGGPIVAVARAPDRTLYALCRQPPALFRSDDDGATWTPCAAFPDPPPVANALSVRPDGRVLVGTGWTGAVNMFVSDDRGASWRTAGVFYLPPDQFAYRRRIRIRNGTNTDLTDYQVRIEVNYEPGKMRADYGDVRFKTGPNPSSADLSYWMEDAGVDRAVFWVKVPSIPRRRTISIWMFYGNPSLTTTSDINATMEPQYIRYDGLGSWVNEAWSEPTLTGGGQWVDLQFTFPYWREPKSRAYLCFYGYLLFDPTAGVVDSSNSADEFYSRCMAAVFWDDAQIGASGDGAYFASYQDRALFEWRLSRVIFGRRACTAQVQAEIWRNGDLRISTRRIRERWIRWTPTIGVSRGNGSDFDLLYNNSTPPQNSSWLYAIRKIVDPAPTVTIDNEQGMGPAVTVLSLYCTEGGLSIAGTDQTGYVFTSGDGLLWTRTTGTFAATEATAVFADDHGLLLAGAVPNTVLWRSTDGGANWNALQQIPSSQRINALAPDPLAGLYAACQTAGATLFTPLAGSVMSPLPGSGLNRHFAVGVAYSRVRFHLDAVDGFMRTDPYRSLPLGGKLLSSLAITYFDGAFNPLSPADQNERDAVRSVTVEATLVKDGHSAVLRTSNALRGPR